MQIFNIAPEKNREAAAEWVGPTLRKATAKKFQIQNSISKTSTDTYNMNLYVSTIAFSGKPVDSLIEEAKAANYALEFSSGLPHHQGIKTKFADYPYPKLAHNYFPAPEVPFVVNLASENDAIRNTSIQHCLQGLEMTKQAGAPFFAAHAGFCLDPDPMELGKQLKQSDQVIDREKHWQIFIESVAQVLSKADELEVDFYIENNVTAAMNINVHGQNPLLCSHYREMIRLIHDMPHSRLGILLDTAHLKVSSITLPFDLKAAIHDLRYYISAIHHSDNEGLLDNNQLIPEDYWFAPFMPHFRNIPQVLEVKCIEVEQINQQLELLTKFAEA